MTHEADLDHCREAIRHGSLSFHAASRLLPRRVRDPALALYAFCRCADDAVDLNEEKAAAVLSLRDRLDLAYQGRPLNQPADRAFAHMVETHRMPRALPEALLEGFAWDAMGRRYETLSEVRAYSARVASTVGAMMAVLMGVRDADALARACDLGVAMQLTNIARDVGEDAREGRLYLPMDRMRAEGLDPEAFLTAPRRSEALTRITRALLAEADRLYTRSEAGIDALPRSARPAIWAARLIYAGIGADLVAKRYDNIGYRAHTTRRDKLAGAVQAGVRTATGMLTPTSAVLHARPLPETAFLVDAAADRRPRESWSDSVVALFAQLEAKDREMHGA